MKKQKLNLSFIKETVSNLEMNSIKGGGMSDLSDCVKTGCCNVKTITCYKTECHCKLTEICKTEMPYPCDTKSCLSYRTYC
ncbi:MAG: hypothetical protein ACEPOW_10180 [Bacteroidales bacterium]